MFWGCISWEGQGELFEVQGTLDGPAYASLLRHTIPLTLSNLNMQAAYLYQDHASCHDSKVVQNVFHELQLRTLENQPSNSPDLNPLEEVRGLWKDRVRARRPKTLNQLRSYAHQEWENLTRDEIRKYIRSMPNRLHEVISFHGNNTKY